ncbi:MAG: hypothetical protein HUK15_06225 [Bacteroidales bacterium]|nr:hypothetical protein [Bacteroidales bacterium]
MISLVILQVCWTLGVSALWGNGYELCAIILFVLAAIITGIWWFVEALHEGWLVTCIAAAITLGWLIFGDSIAYGVLIGIVSVLPSLIGWLVGDIGRGAAEAAVLVGGAAVSAGKAADLFRGACGRSCRYR